MLDLQSVFPELIRRLVVHTGRGAPSWPLPTRLAVTLPCLLAICVVAGCKQPTHKTAANPPSVEDSPPTTPAPDTPRKQLGAEDYRLISQRNIFRPLVVSRQSKGATAAGGGGEEGRQHESPGRSSHGPAPEARPPEPTDDLALTGITETTDGLRVLVEKISTGEGVFAGVGDQVFGLTVKSIGRGTVTLAQADKTYELKLGEKEIPTEKPASTATEEKPSTAQPSTTQTPSASSRPPGPMGPGAWRSMTPEQRRAFFEQRRRWWESLSEEQRQRYRSRRPRPPGPRPMRPR